MFRDLDDRSPMNAEQFKKFIAHKDELLGDGKPVKEGEGVRGWLDARTKDEAVVRAARRRLVEHGLPEERLLRFPADQVILLDEKREFEVRLRRPHEDSRLPGLARRGDGRRNRR